MGGKREIPKVPEPNQPDQYRPITCLNTMYKLFMGMMTVILYRHVMAHDILPDEQKALRKGQRMLRRSGY